MSKKEKQECFELIRLKAKGCRCSNCKYHKIGDWIDCDNTFCAPYKLPNKDICNHKKGDHLISNVKTECCMYYEPNQYMQALLMLKSNL